jgi:hypothetical protein
LTEAFVDARAKTEKLIGSVAVTTYQGLMKALVTYTPQLMPVLQLGLQELMSEIGGKHAFVGRWIAIAIDGSKKTAARTVSNELAFRPKASGSLKST